MTTFFSVSSRKAWVAGVLTAFLQPVLTELSGTNVLTTRSLVIAGLSGILGAVAVWVTDNAESPSPTAVPAAPATGPQAATPIIVPLDPTPTDLTDNFPGQTIAGE